jgi:hypothetical protein
MATGTMGFSIGGNGGEGGEFTCNVVDDGTTVKLLPGSQTDEPLFNDFDLYLMGMLPAESVHPQVVLTGATSPPPCNGQTFTGQVTRVDVNTIIASAGRRMPDAETAPKDFRAATILVSRDGLVSAETMALYSWLTERAELTQSTPIHVGFVKANGNPFYVQTRGLGTVNTLLSSDPDFSLKPAQAAVTVTRGQTATFTISALPTATGFNQPVSFSCGTLIAPLTCSFSPLQVTPGTTGADVVLSVATSATGTASAIWPMGILAGLPVLSIAGSRRRREALSVYVVLAVVATSCGGRAAAPSTPSTPPTSTPSPSATVYSITVTGSAGTLSRTALLTLTVQ